MRNFCTYYWSVEHGRNDRLIQRMHEYLCGHRELEEAGAKSKRKAGRTHFWILELFGIDFAFNSIE